MEEKKNGQAIFLSVVGIATLLVAIVGATFAWFSATVTGNDTAKSVIVNTATLGITYTNGNEIKLDNAIPSANQTKTFTVKNTSDVSTQYKMKWASVTNDFAVKTDLVYSLSGAKDKTGTTISVAETQCPASAGEISGTGTLVAGETHTYTMTVKFKETNSNQNSNQGKKFAGKIEVEAIQTA